MHAAHFLLLAHVSFIATPLGVHQHSEVVEVDHAHISGEKAVHMRAHKHKEGHIPRHSLKEKKLVDDKKTKFYDPTAAKRTKHPLFSLGQRLIHNAKVLLRNNTDADSGAGASDSFVIADHEAKLIVKGHSDYLRRMQRHAGPDIGLARARSLVSHKLDMTKMCSSLMCTAAYTLAYTVGFLHELPTQGCQMVEISEDVTQASLKHDEFQKLTKYQQYKKQKKTEKSVKSATSKKSEKSDFVFFCNAKYPKLLPSVLRKSGFSALQDKPGLWRFNSSDVMLKHHHTHRETHFPLRLQHHHWKPRDH